MSLFKDIKLAARRLVKDRWFTLAAGVALALGIGANTAVFTIVNAVVLRGLPVEPADRIMWIDSRDARNRPFGASRQDFEDWQRGNRSFAAMGITSGNAMNISGDGRAVESYQGAYLSGNGFTIIGEKAILGRAIAEGDDRPDAPPVTVLGAGLWQTRYGSDPTVLGQTIRINGVPFTVVGVMRDGMKFPFNSALWVPFAQQAPSLLQRRPRSNRAYIGFGRLADAASIDQAQAELANVSKELSRQYPDSNKDITAVVTPFTQRAISPQVRLMFWSLLGAVGFVLLIACANVANLLLARAAGRSREIAIQVSLGATRGVIVRQLLVESVLLAVISGVVGLGLAQFGIRWFESNTADTGIPYWMVFTMDTSVFMYVASICLGTGILFGLAPALHVSKANINELLKEGGRSGTGGTRARRWTSALMVVELALTMVLLAGAGFMARTFVELYRRDVGFQTSHLLTMGINMPAAKYTNTESRLTMLRSIEDRLATIGAIQSATTSTNLPLLGAAPKILSVDGRAAVTGEQPPPVYSLGVGSRYFDTLGLRLTRGRSFDPTDGSPGREVVIVNQRLASMFFPGADPVGKRIQLSEDVQGGFQFPWATIVGVSPNVRQAMGDQPEQDPVVYIPHLMNYLNPGTSGAQNLIVRAAGDPGPLTALLRKEIATLDPDMPLANIRTMDDVLALQRWWSRVFGTMFGVFALIAVVLAAVGLYAVTAYSVTQRTAEIGVRMALGAQPEQVWWMVLRRGSVQVAIGLGIGLAGAVGVGRLLKSFLVETGSADPVTLSAISILLMVVAFAACLGPAYQATRLDPATALRHD